MASATLQSSTFAILCVVLAAVYTGSSILASSANNAIDGKQNFLIPLVPVCQDDEFLTSNGTALICRKLPDAGFCDCPGVNIPLEPLNNMTALVNIPLPPTGCPVFSPPTRGAFVCLRNPNVIFCSVLCDHRFEFSSTPRNPYFCGPETNFFWMDFAGKFTHTQLPQCTGFRHRLRMIHPSKFYLPAPCYGLSNHTMLAILLEFQMLLDYEGFTNFTLENTYIQCPSVEASVTFYSQITAREEYYVKK